MKTIIKGIVYFVLAFAANILIGPRTMQPVWDLFSEFGSTLWWCIRVVVCLAALWWAFCAIVRRMKKSDNVNVLNLVDTMTCDE